MTVENAVLGGRYVLLRPIGAGGMGAVWAAKHINLGSEVAIKLLHNRRASAEDCERFDREARSLAALQHPNIVRVYDYAREESLAYLVMERLAGCDLTQVLAERCLTADQTTAVVTQICEALKLAHSRGFIHRDLKPANIFVAREGDLEVVKLLDFGIVKLVDAGGPTSQSFAGTAAYMSPEQVAGATLDGRSDLWSLAVVAVEALTGTRLFASSHPLESLKRITSDPIPRLRDVGIEHPALEAFFVKALSRSVQERFETAAEFSVAFQRAASRQVPTTSVPLGPPTPRLLVVQTDATPRARARTDATESVSPSSISVVPGAPRRSRPRTSTLVGVTGAVAAALWWAGSGANAGQPLVEATSSSPAATTETTPVPSLASDGTKARTTLPVQPRAEFPLAEPIDVLEPTGRALTAVRKSRGATTRAGSSSRVRTEPELPEVSPTALPSTAPVGAVPQPLERDPFSGLPIGP